MVLMPSCIVENSSVVHKTRTWIKVGVMVLYRPECQSQFCHLLAAWSQASYLGHVMDPSLGSFIIKMGCHIIPTTGLLENEWMENVKHLAQGLEHKNSYMLGAVDAVVGVTVDFS